MPSANPVDPLHISTGGNWTDIGGVWPHKDGKGFDVSLMVLPIDGRIVIRLDEPKPASPLSTLGTA